MVAEGVENNEQFELLKNMNCDEFQGYYYSKPLSGDQLIDFLRGQKK
ncbi:EAL domain-containing protein [Klebsiella pneumoniae]|nr:EAL domain-containing protein [Klebsiella pneumoniae]